jgi:LacI family transcriptional regulator
MKSISQPSHRATIDDVAQAAGVSPATVSRVVNGAETVQEGFRRRVEAAIDELGYQPNRLASNLRRKRVSMLGVVVSDIENPHFTEAVRAVEDAAFARGHRVLVCNTDESPEKQREYLRLLAAERVSGVILTPSDPAAPEIAELLDLGVAVVAFDRAVSDERSDLVMVHNADGVRLATEKLVELGHADIGFVGGPTGVVTGDERRRGYLEALLVHNLSPAEADGGFRVDGGRQAVMELLNESPALTAVVFANNLMTLGGLQALASRGLRIPGQMSVVGVDDPFWAPVVNPPLTTLAQPVRAMAQAAVELLFERVDEGRTDARQALFELELRERGSSSGPPARKS